MAANKKIWWEKTVEYAFVRSADFLSVSPLDGDHEQAGDAILSNKKNKFYLIEFKKDYSGQANEIGKYKNKDIKKVFEKLTADYHFIVYGEMNVNTKNWGLYARQYLDYLEKKGTPISHCSFQEEFNKRAVEQDKFLEYVYEIISLKKGNDIDAIGKSGSSSVFANILAINDKGESCSLLDIENSEIYKNRFNISKKNSQDNIGRFNNLDPDLLSKMVKPTQEPPLKTKPKSELKPK